MPSGLVFHKRDTFTFYRVHNYRCRLVSTRMRSLECTSYRVKIMSVDANDVKIKRFEFLVNRIDITNIPTLPSI